MGKIGFGIIPLILFVLGSCNQRNQENSQPATQKNELIEVVKQSTMLVQGQGDFELFDKIFADEYIDHTPQKGGFAADKDGTKSLYKALRQAFPDFRAEIHWQICDGDMVTTYKTYYGTHKCEFLNVKPANKKIQFIAVDVMRVQNGQITEHWGVGDLLSLYKQLDLIPFLENQ